MNCELGTERQQAGIGGPDGSRQRTLKSSEHSARAGCLSNHKFTIHNYSERSLTAAAGQTIARFHTKARGKSELRRAVRRVTPGQGNLKESGTENTQLTSGGDLGQAMVKRCGKSAPRSWQHGWQAKPRTEQGQIGKRYRTARPKLPGRLLDPASNGGARGMIVTPKPDGRKAGGRRRTEFGLRPAAAASLRLRLG